MAVSTLGEYTDYDWSVWFNKEYLIASYESYHMVFRRESGDEIYHGTILQLAKDATGLPPDTEGENYECWWR